MPTTLTPPPAKPAQHFPPFSLSQLLRTVFAPKPGERICILIDLSEPREVEGFRFLRDPNLAVQRQAHDIFYQGLRGGVMFELGLEGGEMFAYAITGGSNLDLPDKGYATDGREVDLVEEVFKRYDILLCISTYSATAPLDRTCQTMRLSRRDTAWCQPDHHQFGPGRRLSAGQPTGGKVAPRIDPSRLDGN
jgi:hypothetical protein